MGNIQELEAQRLVEQQRLDNLKDAGERNRLGQFATPTALARDIAKYTRNLWQERSVPVRFLDPAIGTGSFYSALREVFPSGLIENATGFEIDHEFAEAASQLWASEGLDIIVSDFTVESPRNDEDRFNLVLTNPPYVRHHHLTVSQKQRLKNAVYCELGLEISGLAGFYCYFMLLADKWLAEDGIGIWLIPSEFMTVNYGHVLKQYLMHSVKLLQIHRFCPSDVQFSDALVSSSIVVFQKTNNCAPSAIFSFGGHITKPEKVQHVPLTKLAETRKWTQFPGDDYTTKDDWTLGDLFSIKRGIATGANNFFILPRNEAKALNIPERFQKPILPSPRYLSETVIEADADGYPAIEKQLVLIDCDLPEEEIQRSYTRFWAYLEKGKEQGIHELYLSSRRSP